MRYSRCCTLRRPQLNELETFARAQLAITGCQGVCRKRDLMRQRYGIEESESAADYERINDQSRFYCGCRFQRESSVAGTPRPKIFTVPSGDGRTRRSSSLGTARSQPYASTGSFGCQARAFVAASHWISCAISPVSTSATQMNRSSDPAARYCPQSQTRSTRSTGSSAPKHPPVRIFDVGSAHPSVGGEPQRAHRPV